MSGTIPPSLALASPRVVSVSRSATHSFTKAVASEIIIEAGLGVQNDAHAGVLVRHRYLVRKNPRAANLCQVHLLHAELFAELGQKGIALAAGEMGENITTAGLDLLTLPRGTRLHLGAEAVVELTGLRTPCKQMDGLRPGLMKACLAKGPGGETLRKAGVMAIALRSGTVRAGDALAVELPAGPFELLGPV